MSKIRIDFSIISRLLILFFLVIILLAANYFSGDKFLSLNSLFHHHQEINAWKIYVIEKNNLNPFSYDIKLPDLEGGRFISFFDTPLPYVVGLVLSKLLFFLGDWRFLAAVKLTTTLNYFISIAFFYLLLREIKVDRVVALLFTLLLFTHRQNVIGVGPASMNMPGLWALIIPIYAFLILKKSSKLINSVIFGSSLALSYLQNPYYGFFVSVFLVIPVLLYLLSLPFQRKRLALLTLSVFAFLLVIIPLKGWDIYVNLKTRPEDPESRNYILRQVRTYRPWYHFITPGGHPLSEFINTPQLNFIHFLIDKVKVDPLLLWFPDASNQSYFGSINILFFVMLCLVYLVKRPRGFLRLATFIFSYLIGTAVSSRSDAFFGSTHVVFPWYRLQVSLPLTSLHYYSIFAVFLFYTGLAYMFYELIYLKVIGIRRQVVKIFSFFILTLLFLFSWYDTSYEGRSTPCFPKEDTQLTNYLKENAAKKRLFLQLPFNCDRQFDPRKISSQDLDQELSWDGRFYQIFNKAPIYAKESLNWLDNYRYDSPLKDVRNLNTVLTDANDKKLKEIGIQEVVLYTEFSDASEYWNTFLKPRYQSSKQYKVFGQSVVFSL